MSILGYETSWFDSVSGLSKKLFFKYFLIDNTIEILDDKGAFLKRIYFPSITLNDLYVGNTITVYSRILLIKSYANTATAKYMGEREVHFITIVTQSESCNLGDFLSVCASFDLNIGKIRTTSRGFSTFGFDVPPNCFVLETVALKGVDIEEFLTSSSRVLPNSLIMAISGDKIVEIMKLCVPLDVPENCTLCLVKPHVLKAKACGDLLNTIIKYGFEIGGLMTMHFTPDIGDEIMDVYSNIYSSYSSMLDHLCSSPLMAIMVIGNSDVVSRFRVLTGPLSPELARTLRPHSLRGKYGLDNVRNAVHCTDRQEDGSMECIYLFQTLAELTM